MRWGKRGRAMNNKTGFGSVIGKETGQIVAFGTRNTSCKLVISQKEKEKKQNPMIAVKTGLILRRQGA